jgi:hypothetical protein
MEIQLKINRPAQDFVRLIGDLIADSQKYQARLPFVSAANYRWPQFHLNTPNDDAHTKGVEVTFQQEGASGVAVVRNTAEGGAELIVTAHDDDWHSRLEKAWEHLYYELYAQGNWLAEPPTVEIRPPWWPDNPLAKFDDAIAKRPDRVRNWLTTAISQKPVGFSWENRENRFEIERLTPLYLRTLDVFGEGRMRPTNGVPFPAWDCLLFSFEICPATSGQFSWVRSICAPGLPSEVKEYFQELREEMLEALGQGSAQEEVQPEQMARPRKPNGQGSGLAWSWAGTQTKLAALREIRQQAKMNSRDGRRVTIGRVAACTQAEIDPKTVRKHDPELWARWDDWGY